MPYFSMPYTLSGPLEGRLEGLEPKPGPKSLEESRLRRVAEPSGPNRLERVYEKTFG